MENTPRLGFGYTSHHLCDKALDAQRLDLGVDKQAAVSLNESWSQWYIHFGLSTLNNVRHYAEYTNERQDY